MIFWPSYFSYSSSSCVHSCFFRVLFLYHCVIQHLSGSCASKTGLSISSFYWLFQVGSSVTNILRFFRRWFRSVLVWICRFPLPFSVWEGLRFVIVALPGLFSFLFFICDICFIMVCSLSLLLLVAPVGCTSWLMHFQGKFTYIFSLRHFLGIAIFLFTFCYVKHLKTITVRNGQDESWNMIYHAIFKFCMFWKGQDRCAEMSLHSPFAYFIKYRSCEWHGATSFLLEDMESVRKV